MVTNEERDSVIEKKYAKKELSTLINVSIFVIILWLFSSELVEKIFVKIQGRQIYLSIIALVLILIFLMIIKDTFVMIITRFLKKKK